MTYCTVKSVTVASIPDTPKPPAKTFASYGEKWIAAMMKADAARAVWSEQDPFEASRDTIIRAAESFRGRPFTRGDLMTRIGRSVYNMPAALESLVQDEFLVKEYLYVGGAKWVTYQVPK